MSCNIPVEENIKKASDCKCYGAVMRAYQGLLKAGQPKEVALDAARIVYGYHHPEDSLRNQKLTVEHWIHQNNVH
ncbi:MAG: hypothetical protein GC137_01985 [Alphaproteobacteria bacterium]|nr:hypothetical protein [Alphaproteobacteria bacterium]